MLDHRDIGTYRCTRRRHLNSLTASEPPHDTRVHTQEMREKEAQARQLARMELAMRRMTPEFEAEVLANLAKYPHADNEDAKQRVRVRRRRDA